MNPSKTHRLASLFASAFFTLVMLAGVDTLATSEVRDTNLLAVAAELQAARS
jgi:hypothetical protein